MKKTFKEKKAKKIPLSEKIKRAWVKLAEFLNNLPTPVKIILYRLGAGIMTAISDDLLDLNVDARVYLLLVADTGYNLFIYFSTVLSNKATNLEELKKKYSDQLTIG